VPHFGSSSASPDIAPATLVREAWQLSVAPATWVGDASFSGKLSARLESPNGPLFLRRLPAGTSGQWLQAIHDAVAYVQHRGFTLIPRFLETESGETVVRHGGFWFDLTPWASGEVVEVDSLTADQLANLGGAIADLHLAGTGAPGPPVRFDWLTKRLALIYRLAWDPVPRGKDPWQRVENLAAFFDAVEIPSQGVRVADEVRQVVDVATTALRWFQREGSIANLASGPTTLTHGDLWPDHIRFSGAEVAALLDPDTLALRSPVGDVAALCADFGLWDPGRCDAILASYRSRWPLANEVVAEIPCLGALRTLGVLRQRISAWLDAVHQGRFDASLVGPIPSWCAQLQTITTLDRRSFGALGTGHE
jgi:Ser/Thr protein kinase RdoA (MazF antagonist)